MSGSDEAESGSPALSRRRFLIGTAVAATGIGAATAAAVHDGELGGPPATFRGAVPWIEGTADVPPGASGTDYRFFTPAELSFIQAAVARLIPNDAVGPGQGHHAFRAQSRDLRHHAGLALYQSCHARPIRCRLDARNC